MIIVTGARGGGGGGVHPPPLLSGDEPPQKFRRRLQENFESLDSTDGSSTRSSTSSSNRRAPIIEEEPECDSEEKLDSIENAIREDIPSYDETYKSQSTNCSDSYISWLTNELLDRAESSGPPMLIRDGSFLPILVGIGAHVVKVGDVDMSSSSWSLFLKLELTWYDPRVWYQVDRGRCGQWDSFKDFLSARVSKTVPMDLWLPDISVLNSVDPEPWKSSMGDHEHIEIYDGEWAKNYTWNIRLQTTITAYSVCDLRFTRFPFDMQHCQVILGSLGFSSSMLKLRLLRKLNPKGDLRGRGGARLYHQLEEGLKGYSVTAYEHNPSGEGITIHDLVFTICNPPDPLSHPYQGLWDLSNSRLTIAVRLQREPNFYLMNSVLPLLVMWLLAYATFFLAFEHHDRVGILMSIQLTCIGIMFLTAAHRPNAYADSWIDKFQAISLIMCMLPAVEAVLVARLRVHIFDRLIALTHRFSTRGGYSATSLSTDPHAASYAVPEFIDRFCQISYPGLMLCCLFIVFDPSSVHQYLLDSFIASGPMSRFFGSQFLVTTMLIFFATLWILAVTSHVLQYFNR